MVDRKCHECDNIMNFTSQPWEEIYECTHCKTIYAKWYQDLMSGTDVEYVEVYADNIEQYNNRIYTKKHDVRIKRR